MPLTMIKEGESAIVSRIGGKDEVRRFLGKLGFVPGEQITVISICNGNVIVNIKDSRVAIGKDMAAKIFVLAK